MRLLSRLCRRPWELPGRRNSLACRPFPCHSRSLPRAFVLNFPVLSIYHVIISPGSPRALWRRLLRLCLVWLSRCNLLVDLCTNLLEYLAQFVACALDLVSLVT